MDLFIQFVITFTIIYLGYYIFVVLRNKQYNSKYCPIEIQFIARLYKIDISKVNYHKLLQLVALTNAFIISLTTISVTLVDNISLKMLLCFFLLIPLIICCYSLIGYFYKKKGR